MSIDLDHKLSVLAAAEEVPDAVAVRSNGDCLTYGVLAEKVRDILPQLGDARPYPLFPAAEEVWSDGPNWQTGHWLTGRLGGAPLDALVATILDDAGVIGVDSSALRPSSRRTSHRSFP